VARVGTALGKWVTWALQQADRIDPVVENPPPILDRKRAVRFRFDGVVYTDGKMPLPNENGLFDFEAEDAHVAAHVIVQPVRVRRRRVKPEFLVPEIANYRQQHESHRPRVGQPVENVSPAMQVWD